MDYQEERAIQNWMDQHKKVCRFGRGTDELFSIAEITNIDNVNQIIKVTCMCTASKEFYTHYHGISQ